LLEGNLGVVAFEVYLQRLTQLTGFAGKLQAYQRSPRS
jgi:hypothetical protein